jgi:hypothetical protein
MTPKELKKVEEGDVLYHIYKYGASTYLCKYTFKKRLYLDLSWMVDIQTSQDNFQWIRVSDVDFSQKKKYKAKDFFTDKVEALEEMAKRCARDYSSLKLDVQEAKESLEFALQALKEEKFPS